MAFSDGPIAIYLSPSFSLFSQVFTLSHFPYQIIGILLVSSSIFTSPSLPKETPFFYFSVQITYPMINFLYCPLYFSNISILLYWLLCLLQGKYSHLILYYFWYMVSDYTYTCWPGHPYGSLVLILLLMTLWLQKHTAYVKHL